MSFSPSPQLSITDTVIPIGFLCGLNIPCLVYSMFNVPVDHTVSGAQCATIVCKLLRYDGKKKTRAKQQKVYYFELIFAGLYNPASLHASRYLQNRDTIMLRKDSKKELLQLCILSIESY